MGIGLSTARNEVWYSPNKETKTEKLIKDVKLNYLNAEKKKAIGSLIRDI